MSDLLFLDDLAPGQSFTTDSYEMTLEAIVAFAREFDPQPFHLDAAAAEASFFGRLAASGWHTAAVSMRLLITSGPQMAGGMIGAGGELAWPQPTWPGDVLRVVSTIEAVKPSRSRPDRGMILMRNETRNQRDEVVQLFRPHVVALRRP